MFFEDYFMQKITQLTRSEKYNYLVILSALSLTSYYAMLGIMIVGYGAKDVPFFIKVWEISCMVFRAIIEAFTIAYLSETDSENKWYSGILWGLKFALIALIVITMTPVGVAIGYNKAIVDVLSYNVFWIWQAAVATFSPLMVAAASVAYHIKPHDEGSLPPRNVFLDFVASVQNGFTTVQTTQDNLLNVANNHSEQLANMQSDIAQLQANFNQLLHVANELANKFASMQNEFASLQAPSLDVNQAILIDLQNGDLKPHSHYASQFGLSISAISRRVKTLSGK